MGLTIAELVSRIGEFQSETRTPFASAPWDKESEVIWVETDSTDPIVQNGKVYEYFLEPDVIEQVLDLGVDEKTADAIARVIRYAINDA